MNIEPPLHQPYLNLVWLHEQSFVVMINQVLRLNYSCLYLEVLGVLHYHYT